jgi:hypothetical protein
MTTGDVRQFSLDNWDIEYNSLISLIYGKEEHLLQLLAQGIDKLKFTYGLKGNKIELKVFNE